MFIDFLESVFAENRAAEAIVWRDRGSSFQWLTESVGLWRESLSRQGVPVHSVVALEADFSPTSVAVLLALIEHGCIVVPLAASAEANKREFCELAEVEVEIRSSKGGSMAIQRTDRQADHALLRELKQRRHPGLVLFSSGSTGKSKAAVHDFVPLLDKFHIRRKAHRMAAFLLFDHIGGINTLFYALSNAGCLVALESRSPEDVCSAIEKHRIEVLPTSPTFLNLLLLSESYKKHDLSSLELVTYGTEVMPESTLERLCDLFPRTAFQQTYGLSELGILRSKSKASRSLWVKVGGEGYETRVVDGMLEVKAHAAMLGYLNAPSPFTEDGWFKTGDAVEVDGDFIRILGRRSEIINVGGEKVHPAEIESVLQSMPGVEEAVVTGEQNPFMGQIVTARIRLTAPESPTDFRKRMHEFCRERLARYKVPAKILIVQQPLHGERYKKVRAATADPAVTLP